MKYSIIIPSYNSEKFINIPLDSLEKQTYKDFEVIIIDDGSKDNLKDVVKPYLVRNKSWKYIKKKNGNWGSVINYVRSKKIAKGEYITILDSDDYFEKELLKVASSFNDDIIVSKIAIQEKRIKKSAKVYFSKSGNIDLKKAFTPYSTPHGKFYKSTIFYKMKNLLEGVSYQDTVLFANMVSLASSLYYINEPLAVWWRDREGNSTYQKWNDERASLWLQTCSEVASFKKYESSTIAWSLMYLWELNRNYKKKTSNKISLDYKKAKFYWLPMGVRFFAKIFFIIKVKKFIKK